MSEQNKNNGCAGCSRRSFLVASGAAVVASAALPGCGPATLEGEGRTFDEAVASVSSGGCPNSDTIAEPSHP